MPLNLVALVPGTVCRYLVARHVAQLTGLEASQRELRLERTSPEASHALSQRRPPQSTTEVHWQHVYSRPLQSTSLDSVLRSSHPTTQGSPAMRRWAARLGVNEVSLPDLSSTQSTGKPRHRGSCRSPPAYPTKPLEPAHQMASSAASRASHQVAVSKSRHL